MAMDFGRIVQAAAEAALQSQSATQSQPEKAKGAGKGLTAPRALLLGAGAFTVGRVLMRSRGAGVLEDLQQRLATYESELFGDTGDDDLDQDEFDEDDFDQDEDEEFEEEPEGEYEQDEEPEAEYDEEEEPDGEYDEDEEDEERPRRGRRTSSAGSRNGRH